MVRTAIPATHARHGQRGIYALEFGFVFLLFFALLYAIICYGVLWTLRTGLQHAAEEGARAGLRYQPTAAGTQSTLRRNEAKRIAESRVQGWFVVAPVVVAQICQAETGNCLTPVCDATWARRCKIVVSVRASGLNQMMPLFHFAMPDSLTAQASMLLDGRAS